MDQSQDVNLTIWQGMAILSPHFFKCALQTFLSRCEKFGQSIAPAFIVRTRSILLKAVQEARIAGAATLAIR